MFIITLGQDHKFYTFNVYSSIHSSTPTKPEEMYVWMSIKMNASFTIYPTTAMMISTRTRRRRSLEQVNRLNKLSSVHLNKSTGNRRNRAGGALLTKKAWMMCFHYMAISSNRVWPAGCLLQTGEWHRHQQGLCLLQELDAMAAALSS